MNSAITGGYECSHYHKKSHKRRPQQNPKLKVNVNSAVNVNSPNLNGMQLGQLSSVTPTNGDSRTLSLHIQYQARTLCIQYIL